MAGRNRCTAQATAFVLAVAEVHGIPVEDRERRAPLVLTVLVGEEGKGAVKDLLGPGRTSGAWLAEAELLPLPVVSQLNSKLMQYGAKKAYTIKRTAMAFRQDAARRHRRGRRRRREPADGEKIVTNARMAFGPAPALAGHPATPAAGHRHLIRRQTARTDRLAGHLEEIALPGRRRDDRTSKSHGHRIEASESLSSTNSTFRPERVVGRGDVPQVP